MSDRYTESDVRKLIRCGETTTVQFKEIFSSRKKIAEALGVSAKTIKRDFAILKQKKLVERVGGEKTGYWKVNENEM